MSIFSRLLFLALATVFFHAGAAHAGSLACQGVTVADTSAVGRTVCTKNFYFAGTCNGQDTNPYLNDGVAINTPLAPPWEPVPISIEDIWITFIQAPPTYYAFAGNSYAPDIMTWMTSGGTHHRLPSGMQMPFPASGTAGGPHLDLHISCTPAGAPYQGFYTVVYSPNAQ